MKNVTTPNPQTIFEQIKEIDENGNEYWGARKLAKILEYTDFRNFTAVVNKAKEACKNSGQEPDDHVVGFNEMMQFGKGAKREMESFKLSRYACYLIVQNADPNKEVVALGQTYFAVQTRLQEIRQMEKENPLISFEGIEIRKIWHDEQWFFSVVDVISVLTESKNPNVYWGKLKERETQLLTICQRLKLVSKDKKKYNTDCANTEGILRIVMSIPSSKAEPLKLWLAQVGTERIQETENLEISIDRLTELYRAKGHDDIWISNRLKTIGIRKELTDEWKARGVKEGQEYAILTAEIAMQTFGLTPSEHAKFKGLGKQNLRDHMSNIELVLTAFGEEVTRLIAVKDEAQGFIQNHEAAMKGGIIAGESRARVEKQLGERVVSSENYLHLEARKKTDKLPEGDKID